MRKRTEPPKASSALILSKSALTIKTKLTKENDSQHQDHWCRSIREPDKQGPTFFHFPPLVHKCYNFCTEDFYLFISTQQTFYLTIPGLGAPLLLATKALSGFRDCLSVRYKKIFEYSHEYDPESEPPAANFFLRNSE